MEGALSIHPEHEPGSEHMRRLLKRIESAMTAVAFAEVGEVDTAREIAAETGDEEKDDRGRSPTVVRPGGHVRPFAKGSRAQRRAGRS